MTADDPPAAPTACRERSTFAPIERPNRRNAMKGRHMNVLAFALGGIVACGLVCRSPELDDPPQVRAALRRMTDEARQLLAQIAVLRPPAKILLARDVAAGRLSLAEAAALFGALDQLPPRPPDARPADGDTALSVIEENLCRQVIERVEYVLCADQPPEEVRPVVARLEEDFGHLREHGPIQLPDPSTLVSVPELLKRVQGTLPPNR
jgi:hypothetical protein